MNSKQALADAKRNRRASRGNSIYAKDNVSPQAAAARAAWVKRPRG